MPAHRPNCLYQGQRSFQERGVWVGSGEGGPRSLSQPRPFCLMVLPMARGCAKRKTVMKADGFTFWRGCFIELKGKKFKRTAGSSCCVLVG